MMAVQMCVPYIAHSAFRSGLFASLRMPTGAFRSNAGGAAWDMASRTAMRTESPMADGQAPCADATTPPAGKRAAHPPSRNESSDSDLSDDDDYQPSHQPSDDDDPDEYLPDEEDGDEDDDDRDEDQDDDEDDEDDHPGGEDGARDGCEQAEAREMPGTRRPRAPRGSGLRATLGALGSGTGVRVLLEDEGDDDDGPPAPWSARFWPCSLALTLARRICSAERAKPALKGWTRAPKGTRS